MGRDTLEAAMVRAFYKANQKKKYVGPEARSFKQLWAIAKRYENKLKELDKLN